MPSHEVVCSSLSAKEEWQSAECFVVSAPALAACAPFFMPRLSRVLLLTTSPPFSEGGLPCVSPLDTEKSLSDALRSLVQGAASAVPPAHMHPGAKPEMPAASLTPREMDVLQLTVRGASAKEMAAKLGISVNTVLTHRKNIADKLGVHGAPALVYYAMTHKLV